MPNTVIHHSADYDGIFCREIARKFLPPDTEFIGWDFGQPKVDGLEFPEVGSIYVMDLPPECLANPNRFILSGKLRWIDHHATSIDNWRFENIPGYRIDGVSACRLAWQWFTFDTSRSNGLPTKEQFLARVVREPMAVTLAGEYDIWDHKPSDGDDITFQFALDAANFLRWDALLSDYSIAHVRAMLKEGRAAQNCYAKRDADIVTTRGFDIEFEGLLFRALNTARCNSQSFAAAIRPEHDGCMAFYFNGKTFTFSLYGVEHKPDLDLSKIAVKYGGGGHRAACGFQCTELPREMNVHQNPLQVVPVPDNQSHSVSDVEAQEGTNNLNAAGVSHQNPNSCGHLQTPIS